MGVKERMEVYPSVETETLVQVLDPNGWNMPLPGPLHIGGMGKLHEVIGDETHKRVGNHYVEGGPMDLRRIKVRSEPVSVNRPEGLVTAVGTMYPQFCGYGVDTNLPLSGLLACASYGATAWNKFKPGKPQVALSNFIAELRDLPQMLRAQSYAHRNIGQHYLSAQFGWLPFISDVKKMIETYKNLDSIFNNLSKNSGRFVKRGGSVVENSTVIDTWDVTGYLLNFAPMPHTCQFDAPSRKAIGELTATTKVWFTGRFCYYLPSLGMGSGGKDRFPPGFVRKVYGLTIGPAELWEAMPWSWLIDYFTNAGDVLSNMQNGVVGDVVAEEAWVMRTHTIKASQISELTWNEGDLCRGRVTAEQETKCRVAANPFGFGMSMDDLSNRQLAILGALGIARAF